MASEAQLNAVRDNIRVMIAKGATFEEMQAYMQAAQEVTGTTATLGQLMRMGGGITGEQAPQHPEMMPGQQPHVPFQERAASNLPLAQMRDDEQRLLRGAFQEGEPGRLGDVMSGTAAAVSSAAMPARMVPQVLGSSAAAAGGRALGDVVDLFRQDEPVTGEQIQETVGDAFSAGATNAAFVGATFGLGSLLGFLRGKPPTATQAQGQQFAKDTKVDGFTLPAPAEDFAERTAAGKLGVGMRNMSASAKLWARQQGQKVARFIGDELTHMQRAGRGLVREPSNVADEFAQWAEINLLPKTQGQMFNRVQRFARGVGETRGGYETADTLLEQLFSPTNKDVLAQLKAQNPQMFDDLAASWLTSAIRRFPGENPSQQFLSVNGPRFREWFESNLPMVKEVFGAEQARAWDNFTSYVAFASKVADRAFPESAGAAVGGMAVPGALSTGIASLGGVPGSAGYETLTGLMGWAMSKPGNSIYKLFSQPFADAFPRAAAAGHAMRLGGQAALQGGFTRKGRDAGEKIPKRERRAGDVRYTPPSFPPRRP